MQILEDRESGKEDLEEELAEEPWPAFDGNAESSEEEAVEEGPEEEVEEGPEEEAEEEAEDLDEQGFNPVDAEMLAEPLLQDGSALPDGKNQRKSEHNSLE